MGGRAKGAAPRRRRSCQPGPRLPNRRNERATASGGGEGGRTTDIHRQTPTSKWLSPTCNRHPVDTGIDTRPTSRCAPGSAQTNVDIRRHSRTKADIGRGRSAAAGSSVRMHSSWRSRVPAHLRRLHRSRPPPRPAHHLLRCRRIHAGTAERGKSRDELYSCFVLNVKQGDSGALSQFENLHMTKQAVCGFLLERELINRHWRTPDEVRS
jgi:hypothetical protein